MLNRSDTMKGNAKAQARRPALSVPADLARALRADAGAEKNFARLPPSCRREYIKWIAEAKKPETRARRINSAIAMLREGRRHGESAPR